MTRLHAATWVAPDDEVDRGNVLGAAVATSERYGRDLAEIVEGAGNAEQALQAARRTGLLIVPASQQVMPELADAVELLRRARDEDWRLLLLNFGADSRSPGADELVAFLARLASTSGPSLDGPVPPVALRHRVGGGSEDTFRRSGLAHVECFAAALATAGIELAQARALLEWGAGCGRMTAHLAAWAPGAQITAVDTDAEAIGWVGEHLDVHAAAAIDVLPPTALADDTFDVVVGHSVFSHLPVAAQDRWLAELARVTRPGGHVAVSFNGPVAMTWHREHPQVDVPRSVERALARDGIAIWVGDGWEDEFYEGYHTTFQRHDYIREHWSRWFDVVLIDERGAAPVQDIAVLRARASGARASNVRAVNEDTEQIQARIASVGHWHHRIPIAPGIVTPGVQHTDEMLAQLALPDDCTGMRVLDIGARDGFFSFEVEQRGAKEVVALDNVAPDRTGFAVARDLLGSKVEYVIDNVYNLNAEDYGTFDLVLFLGVLYHLRHPLLALDHIWDVCNPGAQLFVESHMIEGGLVDDHGNFHQLDHFHTDLKLFPLVQFFPDKILGNDFTSKWAPNQYALRGMLGASGFDVTREWLHVFRGGVTAVARELDPDGQRAADAAAEWDLTANNVIRGTRFSPPTA